MKVNKKIFPTDIENNTAIQQLESKEKYKNQIAITKN